MQGVLPTRQQAKFYRTLWGSWISTWYAIIRDDNVKAFFEADIATPFSIC